MADLSGSEAAAAAAAAAPPSPQKKGPTERKARNFPTLQRIYLLVFTSNLIKQLFDPSLPAPQRLLHIQHRILAHLQAADPDVRHYFYPHALRAFKDKNGKATVDNHMGMGHDVDPVAVECINDLFERGATVQSVEHGVQARTAIRASTASASASASTSASTSTTRLSKRKANNTIDHTPAETTGTGRKRTKSNTRSSASASIAPTTSSDSNIMHAPHYPQELIIAPLHTAPDPHLAPPPPFAPSSSSATLTPALPLLGAGANTEGTANDPAAIEAAAAAAAAAAAVVEAASVSQSHQSRIPSAGGAGAGAANEAVAADALRLMKTTVVHQTPPHSHSHSHPQSQQPTGAMAAAISAAQEMARRQGQGQGSSSSASLASSASAAGSAHTANHGAGGSAMFAQELASIISSSAAAAAAVVAVSSPPPPPPPPATGAKNRGKSMLQRAMAVQAQNDTWPGADLDDEEDEDEEGEDEESGREERERWENWTAERAAAAASTTEPGPADHPGLATELVSLGTATTATAGGLPEGEHQPRALSAQDRQEDEEDDDGLFGGGDEDID
ncbi:unnamed protein product [Tilletia caries]|uniref:Uncharacterized protein n=2 Tax=Tilletia TaxID=13289 RepID=A0A177U0G7_9BASI|nr:hypothetical protein CF336_g9193 [Tilletia laevis]KAE8181062.1 hypothetical protein CF328_g8960 [Tilletia controversa]KAE8240104.1 hypothetical protein A4X03_0g8597 [Tilletia caries]KAE8181414.1 hypothetical protein CF335_g8942 [Tilletia laevis]CAD6891070.1 unnamed protein product [Tilletia caries]